MVLVVTWLSDGSDPTQSDLGGVVKTVHKFSPLWIYVCQIQEIPINNDFIFIIVFETQYFLCDQSIDYNYYYCSCYYYNHYDWK